MKLMRIRPVAGKKIRDPKDGRVLPADRTTVVPANSYWSRRIAQNDVVEYLTEAKVETSKVKKEKSQKNEKQEEKS